MVFGPLSTADIEASLADAEFPAMKRDLVEHARRKQAEQQTLQVLEQIADEKYSCLADVYKGVAMTDTKGQA